MSQTRFWKLNNISLENEGRWRTLWETGSPGMAGPRLVETEAPTVDGATAQPSAPLGAPEQGFVLWVGDLDERGQHGGYRQRRANEAYLKRLLASTKYAPGTLTLVEEFTRRSHAMWDTPCVLSSNVEVTELTIEECKLTFTLKLLTGQWAEATTRYSECLSDPDDGRVMLDGFSGGSAPAYPLWVVHGPVSNFYVIDCGTHQVTSWSGASVEKGELLLVDTKTYRWGKTALTSVWPLVEESPEWDTKLIINPDLVGAAAPITPDVGGKYYCRVLVDGVQIPADRVTVMCRGKKVVY
ncbi:hypothetical protein [Mobiluncus curtisii]|uniref:hypothetical protein n=1 Tax=Mobiluncus curtisii TaxID=2051 RepID=UPI00146FDFE7|nr:hypothetical protein [Mobiluncus curtisii]NMW88047.1 hypothetical protein [Mobiluncus curtisii]